jgi:hypothetical protein
MHFVTLTDHQVATLLQNAKLRANDVLGGESRARERPVKIVLDRDDQRGRLPRSYTGMV